MKPLLITIIFCFLSGCVYVPENSHSYDETCNVMRKKKVLKLEQTTPLAHCSNEACALLMASYGLVTAASFVISGSIVVVSNTVYWLERPSDCNVQLKG